MNKLEEKLKTYSFEMFSSAGDNACRSLVRKVFKKIGGKSRVTQESITKMIGDGCEKIQVKFREVYDTEPGYHIADLVNQKLSEVGYCFEVSRYDF
jgi:hypothetical protein